MLSAYTLGADRLYLLTELVIGDKSFEELLNVFPNPSSLTRTMRHYEHLRFVTRKPELKEGSPVYSITQKGRRIEKLSRA